MRGALVGAALALALAGCSSGGVAAVVDGRRIPVSEVHQAVTELAPVADGVSLSSVLTALIVEPTFTDVAKKYGADVSDAQVVKTLNNAFAQKELTPPASYGRGTLDVMRFSAAVGAFSTIDKGSVAASEAEARAQKLDVDVNPRFGSLDFKTGEITRSTLPWIVAGASPAQ